MSTARPTKTERTTSTRGRVSDPRARLGLRIKQLRAAQDITQEEFADRVGMYRTYVSRLESGRANPTLTMLYDIAEAFKVDITQLFAISGQDVPRRVQSKSAKLSRGRVTP